MLNKKFFYRIKRIEGYVLCLMLKENFRNNTRVCTITLHPFFITFANFTEGSFVKRTNTSYHVIIMNTYLTSVSHVQDPCCEYADQGPNRTAFGKGKDEYRNSEKNMLCVPRHAVVTHVLFDYRHKSRNGKKMNGPR